MHRYGNHAWLGAILFLLISFPTIHARAISLPPENAPPAPKGSRPATKDDLEWMKWVGIPDPKEGMLVNPDDPNIGKSVGETKQWLAQHATKNANIICLAPQFAEKLKKFMEAVPGGIPTISDGYRNPNKQTALVASGASRAGPCQSYHNYGLAADFNNGGNIRWMRANSRNFGIGTIGEWDPNHFQNGDGKYGACGACSNDQGNGVIPPSSSSPSANFANAIRQALGMQQQPIAQPPLPPQALQQNQSPIDAFKEPTSQMIATSSEPVATTTSSSIADELARLAGIEPTATTTRSATSVPIIIDGSDVGRITSTRTSGERATTSGLGAGITQNTFTSDDLAFQAEPGGTQGAFSQILASIKVALLQMLRYLRPFGGTLHYEGNSEEMYLE